MLAANKKGKRCSPTKRHLNIEKIIGIGAFGQVAKGTAVGLRGRPETTTVAIKMLKSEFLYCIN